VSDDQAVEIPVWTLAQQEVTAPPISEDGPMTAERLRDLRTLLATYADAPLTTLEARPVPKDLDRTQGIALDSASPLATHLTQLVTETANVAKSVGIESETLFRMVVPARFASQLGNGLLRPMASEAGGIHSALMGSSGIAGQAKFVPVAVGGATLTAAAPLIMLAVGAAISINAQRKQQQTLDHVVKLLEKLDRTKLDDERKALNASRRAIDKATAILLDEGELGHAVGIGNAVGAVHEAIEQASTRLQAWKEALDNIGSGKRVELAQLKASFPGIEREFGEFYAHLDLANMAIALMERVIVVQSVEQAQKDTANGLSNFMRKLDAEAREIIQMKSDINSVLQRISTLRIGRSHGLMDFTFSPSEVDALLDASYRVRSLSERVEPQLQSDVAIDIVRSSDGSLRMLPPVAAS
jgi:hypothetical protein